MTDARQQLRQCARAQLLQTDDRLPCSRKVLRALIDDSDQMDQAEALKALADLYRHMADVARTEAHRRQE